ncbi:MAG: SulP family inorganic anion transporter [Verrucomicrobia bacterium]|nr:SulP family inorganic anion transporter [Verrucomicrobiota bacterium]
MSAISELTDGVSGLSSQMFKVRFPFVGELKNYSWEKFRGDLLAGATLTLVSIPQAIGFSLILNLPPQPVIAAVIIGGLVGALFFSSHHHVFGPTSSISLIVAATVAAHSGSGLEPLEMAIYLAFLIGLIQFLAGLLNFGEITKFISRSVVVGYSTGIGVLLIGSQLHNILGYEVGPAQNFVTNVWQAVNNLGASLLHPWAIGIGVFTLLVFEAIRRFRPRWPEALIGLALLGIMARLYMIWEPAAPFRMVQDEGALHAMFPSFAGFHFGPRKLHLLPDLVGTAIAISILGMLEATSITKALAGKSGQKIEPNQELMGMGAANIACALFGCVPGSSSFARSAVNFQSGARTQMASILSSFVVLFVLLFVTPVFNYIPIAALAAHLIRVGVKMINFHQIRIACRSTRSDAVVFVVTLASCLFLQLDTAIYVGIGVALALFLQKTSTPTLAEYAINPEGQFTELRDPSQRPHPQISIIHVEGDLYFGAADLFQEQVRRLAENQDIRVFILRMKNARHLDASTVMALETLHDYLRQTGRHLLISGSNRDVTRVLKQSGLLAQLGEANLFPAADQPMVATRMALKRAKELLPDKNAQVRLFYEKDRLPPDATPPAPPSPAPAS